MRPRAVPRGIIYHDTGLDIGGVRVEKRHWGGQLAGLELVPVSCRRKRGFRFASPVLTIPYSALTCVLR